MRGTPDKKVSVGTYIPKGEPTMKISAHLTFRYLGRPRRGHIGLPTPRPGDCQE